MIISYFAYGSNMAESQIKFRCADATFMGVSKLNNKSFFINAKGVASIKDKAGSYVQGIVWALSNNDVQSLDAYEGYPNSYIKIYYEILLNNKVLPVLVYESTNLEIGNPREGYLEKIIKTAQTLSFDNGYISELCTLMNQD